MMKIYEHATENKLARLLRKISLRRIPFHKLSPRNISLRKISIRKTIVMIGELSVIVKAAVPIVVLIVGLLYGFSEKIPGLNTLLDLFNVPPQEQELVEMTETQPDATIDVEMTEENSDKQPEDMLGILIKELEEKEIADGLIEERMPAETVKE